MQNLSKEYARFYNKKLTAQSGCLYIISTPIGNFDDISLRAIKIINFVDFLLCEDTRKSKKLLSYLKIKNKKLISYNDNNAEKKRPYVIKQLLQNMNIGLISDAGTPLISDPGYKIIQDCYLNNIKVTHAPGATSVINALILSGLPTNQFFFGGFLSSKKSAREKQLLDTKYFGMTGIWFDTCLRINSTLRIMQEIFGNRKISIARELTKTYEEIIASDLDNILNIIDKREKNYNPLKGEIILIVDGYAKEDFNIETLNIIIKNKLKKLSLRDTVNEIITETKLPRRVIYNEAIKIRNDKCT